jgi:hypothetical protein
MSQLVLNSIPGFSDLPDTAIAAGEVLTDATIRGMSHHGKFATVRGKLIFMGFYAHGNTVPTPYDADDGYAYARNECQYMFMPYSNRAPAPGFVPGQAAPPAAPTPAPPSPAPPPALPAWTVVGRVSLQAQTAQAIAVLICQVGLKRSG